MPKGMSQGAGLPCSFLISLLWDKRRQILRLIVRRLAAQPFLPSYRRCPITTPSLRAFCLSDPTERFNAFAILETGVRAFEWARNVFTSAFVYPRAIFFFAFLATRPLHC